MRYTSTGLEGEPVAVSGVVMAPAEPRDRPGGPRPVLAPPTAPRASFAIATDYPGLGTPGHHRPRSRSSASPRAATPRCSPVLAIDVTADGRWATLLAENTPACGIGVPLLATQGEADTALPCLGAAEVTDLTIIMRERAGEGLPTLRPAPLGPRLAASRRTP